MSAPGGHNFRSVYRRPRFEVFDAIHLDDVQVRAPKSAKIANSATADTFTEPNFTRHNLIQIDGAIRQAMMNTGHFAWAQNVRGRADVDTIESMLSRRVPKAKLRFIVCGNHLFVMQQGAPDAETTAFFKLNLDLALMGTQQIAQRDLPKISYSITHHTYGQPAFSIRHPDWPSDGIDPQIRGETVARRHRHRARERI
eukprot:TRINITY_DN3572_c1_g3_i1.p1 TRINITY_DN3572_c1_g3~~TRINITY_DN3572_c1_g3_i1.p1  ORF type:complete len:198 (+),score=5.00 TRINITY_DN3572_c1_g3_i1:132-725(+)